MLQNRIKQAALKIKKYISLNIEHICWLLMALQLIVDSVAEHSILFHLSCGGFLIVTFAYLYKIRAIKISKYHIITLIFILYNILLIIFGSPFDRFQSFKMVRTVVLNLILSIAIFSLLMKVNDSNKLLKTYVYFAIITNIIIFFIYRDSLLSGRLAFSWKDLSNTYRFLGMQIRTTNSNGIAYYSAAAFIFSGYLYSLKENKRFAYLLICIFLVFVIVITGSRKGLFFLAMGLFILIHILTDKNNKKKIIYYSAAIGAMLILYLIINHVPVLYNIVGWRLNQLINLLTGANVRDGSINTRLKLIEEAVEFFKQRPIFGYGLDSFRVMYKEGIVADNNYLDILVSSGIIGFIIYYSYVLFVLRDYIKTKNKSKIFKILICMLVINLILEIGSTTYFVRNYVHINTIFYFLSAAEGDEKSNLRKGQGFFSGF